MMIVLNIGVFIVCITVSFAAGFIVAKTKKK